MIYVVSGYRRSGTTAMMKALVSGGIPAATNKRIDRINNKMPVVRGYMPNPRGALWEMGHEFYMVPDLMRAFVDNHQDCAIKIFFDGLPWLPVCEQGYTVIFMRRPDEEIRASVETFEKYRGEIMQQSNPKDKRPFDIYRDYNPDHVQWCLDIAKQRRDITVHEVWFADLVDDPVGVIEGLGLPVDVKASATAIDHKWYRNREIA